MRNATIAVGNRQIDRYVSIDPHDGDARMLDGGANVWALVAYQDANHVGLSSIAQAFGLPDDAVRAALAYYQRHKARIDARLLLNSIATDEELRAEDDLIRRHIEQHPEKPGRDEAILVDSGISVWALVGYLPAVKGDIAQVAKDYRLPLEAVEAALTNYRRHKAIIDNRIEANRFTDGRPTS